MKKQTIITTHELGKYILKKGVCPIPLYHVKGYMEPKRNKTIKF